jgi:two-component system nitrogen regulation sensor histidine kinase NtrY
VTFANRRRRRLLAVGEWRRTALAVAVPELLGRLARKRCGARSGMPVQKQSRLVRTGQAGDALVRCRPAAADDGSLEGYVVAFDDVTGPRERPADGRLGRRGARIAHEIKNPLDADPPVGRAHQAQVGRKAWAEEDARISTR